jgi:hypothetical protein
LIDRFTSRLAAHAILVQLKVLLDVRSEKWVGAALQKSLSAIRFCQID